MSTTLIKIGGSFAVEESNLRDLCKALAQLKAEGENLVLVHGGGKDINANLGLLSEEPNFVDGLRVTSPNILNMVEMTLSGHVNKKLSRFLSLEGAKALGLAGTDSNLIQAKQKSKELGQVGEVVDVNVEIVQDLLKASILPVVSPLAIGKEDGLVYNVNADNSASAVAQGLKVDKLVFLSDVPGVMEEGNVISSLDSKGADALIEKEVISGGMIPKIQSCFASLDSGVSEVHIMGWSGVSAFVNHIKGSSLTGTVLYK